MRQWKSIVIFDANMILRYLLNDHAEMAKAAQNYLDEAVVTVTIEVIAEVVYVLKGVYRMDRSEIANVIGEFLQMVECRDSEIVLLALETYSHENLDFVDCVLYAYHRLDNLKVATFDKKLLRLLNQNT